MDNDLEAIQLLLHHYAAVLAAADAVLNDPFAVDMDALIAAHSNLDRLVAVVDDYERLMTPQHITQIQNGLFDTMIQLERLIRSRGYDDDPLPCLAAPRPSGRTETWTIPGESRGRPRKQIDMEQVLRKREMGETWTAIANSTVPKVHRGTLKKCFDESGLDDPQDTEISDDDLYMVWDS